jgi:hypothetical protein
MPPPQPTRDVAAEKGPKQCQESCLQTTMQSGSSAVRDHRLPIVTPATQQKIKHSGTPPPPARAHNRTNPSAAVAHIRSSASTVLPPSAVAAHSSASRPAIPAFTSTFRSSRTSNCQAGAPLPGTWARRSGLEDLKTASTDAINRTAFSTLSRPASVVNRALSCSTSFAGAMKMRSTFATAYSADCVRNTRSHVTLTHEKYMKGVKPETR